MYSLSVILAIKNEEELIEQSIKSILNQTLYAFELIIINDGSTDNTKEICERYERYEPLIVKVINQEELGIAAAKNTGLKVATGDYIYFADVNNILDNNLLEDNLKLAQEREADLVIFGFESNKTEESIHLPNLPQLKNREQFRKHYRNYHNFFPYYLHNKIYNRRYLINNNIYFNYQKYNENSFFNLLVYEKIHSVAVNRKNLLSIKNIEHQNNVSYTINDHAMKVHALESLLLKWEMQDVFSDVIFNEYFNLINNELINIFKNKQNLSKEERQHKIILLLDNPYIDKFLINFNEKKIKNRFKRRLFISLKNHNLNRIEKLVIAGNRFLKGKHKTQNFIKKLF